MSFLCPCALIEGPHVPCFHGRPHGKEEGGAHQRGDVWKVGVIVESESLGDVRDHIESTRGLRVVGPGGLLLPWCLGPVQ